ncbi:hypothetical protein Nmel_010719 [Mimus melanotis]
MEEASLTFPHVGRSGFVCCINPAHLSRPNAGSHFREDRGSPC